MGFFDWLGGGGGGDDELALTGARVAKPVQLPDYPEAEGARVSWWDTLQKWQTQPGYGAVPMNWNDIWENARKKVQRYFMGGPEGPGAIAGVQSNLARRGMSEQPAAETAISRLGMQQGNLLSDMAVQQATQEAAYEEQGRTNWLSSLQQLAGLKPAFAIGSEIYGQAPVDPIQSATGGFSGGMLDDIMGMFGGEEGGVAASPQGIDSYLQLAGGGGGFAGGGGSDIGSVMSMFGGGGGGGYKDEFYKDPQFYMDAAKLLAMFAV